MDLVIATGNPHKVDEFRALFAPARGVRVLGLKDLPGAGRFVEPAETGATFEENVRIKAEQYAQQTGRLCLADDSGLEVDALGGRPGVISSHYATGGRETGATREERDRANNRLVLEQLHGVPPERRSARFVCVLALAAPPGFAPTPRMLTATPYDAPNDPLLDLAPALRRCAAEPGAAHVLLRARGEFEGRIGVPPRVPSGRHGFGYDPLFLVKHPTGSPPTAYAQTGAELDPESKNRLSHRARAANIMLDLLVRSGIADTPA